MARQGKARQGEARQGKVAEIQPHLKDYSWVLKDA
jgi:hypothetical protein